MNVFAIESPCDDAFYGFQSFAICSSFDIVSEKLTNICKTTIKYNYFPEKKHKLGLILRDKDTDFDTKKILCVAINLEYVILENLLLIKMNMMMI